MFTGYEAAGAAKPVTDKPVPSEKKRQIRICDYVTFSDVHGNRHRGLVRWIGTDKSVLLDGTTIVGIETVSGLTNMLYIIYSCSSLMDSCLQYRHGNCVNL